MPERNVSPWSRSGPLLAGALIALVSAGVQKVYSERTLGEKVDGLELQLREHAVILAGPSGVTIQLTEIREAIRECGGGSVALAAEPPLLRRQKVTEAP